MNTALLTSSQPTAVGGTLKVTGVVCGVPVRFHLLAVGQLALGKPLATSNTRTKMIISEVKMN